MQNLELDEDEFRESGVHQVEVPLEIQDDEVEDHGFRITYSTPKEN